MSTNDVENTNGTNPGDLLFTNKLRTFPRRTEKDAVREQEEQEIYNTLMATFSERVKRDENVAMAWISDKRAYDMVLQNWIIDCLKMYKISGAVYRGNHEKPENGTDSRRKKLS